jgi:glutamate synthase domain-containing protein 3
MVGRASLLEKNPDINHAKTENLDFSKIFYFSPAWKDMPLRFIESQKYDMNDLLDNTLIKEAKQALQNKKPVTVSVKIRNTDRAVGTMLSSRMVTIHGEQGLPDDSISVKCIGTAGQSFGAFCAPGITLTLEGEANDYVGKALSGGKLIIFPPKSTTYLDQENVLIGNVALYGATSGEAYFRGIAGERFAIRNSGVKAVVEGVGYHGCEYMTGGTVVILGKTGLNFGAGMSGGIAYILDIDGLFDQRCNLDMVDLDLLEREEDISEVKKMIADHVAYTGSTIGSDILKNWISYQSKFIKVFPMEYRKVLGQMIKDDAETEREILQHG